MRISDWSSDVCSSDLSQGTNPRAKENIMNAPITTVTGERADLLQSLRRHREFLLFTVKDLTDEQAASRPTVSELCLGGLIKHVGQAEKGWVDFILEGPAGLGGDFDPTQWSEEMQQERANEFAMVEGETLAGIVSEYGGSAARTDELVADRKRGGEGK